MCIECLLYASSLQNSYIHGVQTDAKPVKSKRDHDSHYDEKHRGQGGPLFNKVKKVTCERGP